MISRLPHRFSVLLEFKTVRNQPVGGGGNYIHNSFPSLLLVDRCGFAALRAQLINEQNRVLRAPRGPSPPRYSYRENPRKNPCLGKIYETVAASPNSTMQMQVTLLNKWFFVYTWTKNNPFTPSFSKISLSYPSNTSFSNHSL
jgi:hypothetical protein